MAAAADMIARARRFLFHDLWRTELEGSALATAPIRLRQFGYVVAEGLVLFGSSADDSVYALDEKTGTVVWRYTTDAPVRFAPHVVSSSYEGIVDLDGTKCHHILVTQAAMDWQLWVEAGDMALPRKLEITYRDELLEPVFLVGSKGHRHDGRCAFARGNRTPALRRLQQSIDLRHPVAVVRRAQSVAARLKLEDVSVGRARHGGT